MLKQDSNADYRSTLTTRPPLQPELLLIFLLEYSKLFLDSKKNQQELTLSGLLAKLVDSYKLRKKVKFYQFKKCTNFE